MRVVLRDYACQLCGLRSRSSPVACSESDFNFRETNNWRGGGSGSSHLNPALKCRDPAFRKYAVERLRQNSQLHGEYLKFLGDGDGLIPESIIPVRVRDGFGDLAHGRRFELGQLESQELAQQRMHLITGPCLGEKATAVCLLEHSTS